MSGPLAAALLALAVATFTGGGGQSLWARYRAERSSWHARRMVARIQIEPRLATPGDYERAIAAYRSIVEAYPASRWAMAWSGRDSVARQVGEISGNALIAIGRLEEARGNPGRALALYARAAADYRALLPVRLEASLARCAALERGGNRAASAAALGALGRDFPLVDPASGEPIRSVIEAPLRMAEMVLAQGDIAGSDSVLGAAERRFLAALRHERGGPAAPMLWLGLARARAAQDPPARLDPALAALRSALAEPRLGELGPRVVLNLAEYCLRGGRPDSALAYTAWAARAYPDPVRSEAMMLEAQAWEEKGAADSAVAAYERLIESAPGASARGALARFRRGAALEKAGRWEQARSEYRALVAINPAGDLAMQALERIVRHHADRREQDLAQIECRRALESLEQILSTNRDADVLLRARQTRARLLLAIEDWSHACLALTEIWRSYPGLTVGVNAGFRAAQVAESNLKDPARAAQLYRDLAARSDRPEDQRRARSELARLGGIQTQPGSGEATSRS